MVDNRGMRTLAVGDIHGCLNSLIKLMEFLQLQPTDRLVFLGDYIDRGPNSKGVIDWILQKKGSMEVITLRGNHEDMMMESRSSPARRNLWAAVGGEETLRSYEVEFSEKWAEAVPEAHWGFLKQTQLYLETAKHIYVHGMVNSERSMEEQDPYLLVWTKCFGMKPHQSGKKVICGHTAHKDGNVGIYDFGYCIDTAACKGGWLTCFNAETGDYWQANEQCETRSGKVEA